MHRQPDWSWRVHNLCGSGDLSRREALRLDRLASLLDLAVAYLDSLLRRVFIVLRLSDLRRLDSLQLHWHQAVDRTDRRLSRSFLQGDRMIVFGVRG